MLGPLVTDAEKLGAIAGWWFIRKGDTWRIRAQSPADGFVEQATACLLRADGVTSVTETIYEPETAAFGGPEAMDVAHRLFHADSRCLLGQIAQPGRELHRELPLVLASRMLRAARQEWHEQGDCWARLAGYRDDGLRPGPCPATVDSVLTLLTAEADAPASPLRARPDWSSAFEDAGRLLAGLAGQGVATRGLRAVLAHHLLFLFNRHGLSAADQYLLASAAGQAIFGPAEGPHADTARKPADTTAVTARVGSVTTTASLSDENRAARLRDGLADYIKSWGTFQTRQVEAAFRTVSRHLFLPGASLDEAYGRDSPGEPAWPPPPWRATVSAPAI